MYLLIEKKTWLEQEVQKKKKKELNNPSHRYRSRVDLKKTVDKSLCLVFLTSLADLANSHASTTLSNKYCDRTILRKTVHEFSLEISRIFQIWIFFFFKEKTS